MIRLQNEGKRDKEKRDKVRVLQSKEKNIDVDDY